MSPTKRSGYGALTAVLWAVSFFASIAIAAAGTGSWSSGAYAYDGAGNVTQIGGSVFVYDPVDRLTSATLSLLPGGGGTLVHQGYVFDAFGNLQSVTGASARTTPTSSSTNRLNGAGTAYDAAGNLTAWNGATYEYDAFDQLKHYASGSEEWLYMYDADDERVWSFKPGRFDRWTLRDLSGKVLRTYEATNYNWTGSVAEDDVYRDGLLLAAETPQGTRHFHLDHLGTPRLVTDASGAQAAYHVYYPFGEEATAWNQDTERMKFTGHERDLASAAGPGDDLDSTLRIGEGSGEAVGSGAGALAVGVAVTGDLIGAASLADPAAGALKGVVEEEIAGAGKAAAIKAARALGEAGEAAVGDIGERIAFRVNGKLRIPDGLKGKVLSEVKNVKRLSLTSQLQDYSTIAKAHGYRFELYVRHDTVLSKPLQELINQGDIVKRYIP